MAMKKFTTALGWIASLFFNSACLAQIAADKGDIVIFNMPLHTEKIKVQLYQCDNKQRPCKTWSSLMTESIELDSGSHYVFKIEKKIVLQGSEIGAKVYGVPEDTWSDVFPLIPAYTPEKDPFYQFFCWSRQEAAPHFFCTSGEVDEEAKWNKKLIPTLSLIRKWLHYSFQGSLNEYFSNG